MSISQWIISIIEVLVVAAVIIGFMYEPIVADWEQKQKEKVLKAFKDRRRFRGENKNV